MKIGNLTRGMREDIFNHMALYGDDPDITEKEVYNIDVPIRTIILSEIPPEFLYKHMTDEHIDSYYEIMQDEETKYGAILDGHFWDGLHRLTALTKKGEEHMTVVDLSGLMSVRDTGSVFKLPDAALIPLHTPEPRQMEQQGISGP